MILTVGNKIKLGGLIEVIKIRLGDDIKNVPENSNIRNQENDVLHEGREAKYIIYDTDQYYNDSEEIIGVIKRIYRTNKAKVILVVPTDNPKNELVKEAVSNQLKYLICSSDSLGMQKDQLEKILSGYYDHNEIDEITEIEKEIADDNKRLNDFVGELYDAKQREEEKERTIIVNKKSTGEVIINFLVGAFKTIFAILSVILMAIAVITLVYTTTREAFISVMSEIWLDIQELI